MTKKDLIEMKWPHDMTEEFDRAWERLGYSSRTGCVKELVRKFLKENEKEEGAKQP